MTIKIPLFITFQSLIEQRTTFLLYQEIIKINSFYLQSIGYNQNMNNAKKIVIAFDGPDNVGKSTQIKLLRKKYKNIPFLIIDVDAPVGEDFTEKLHYGKEHSKITLDTIKKIPYSQIHDRIHYTEYAYSFFRGGHTLDDIIEIEKKYEEIHKDLLIITFIDRVENISARDDGLSQFNKEDHENIVKLVHRFKEISNMSIFDNHIIDIHGKDIDTVHNEVIHHVEQKFPFLK